MLDAIDRVICDVGQNGAKVQFWIEAVEPGAPDQRVNGSGQVASGVGRQFIVPEFWYVPAQQLMPCAPWEVPMEAFESEQLKIGCAGCNRKKAAQSASVSPKQDSQAARLLMEDAS